MQPTPSPQRPGKTSFLHWPLTLAATMAAGVFIGASLFGAPSGRDDLARNSALLQEVMAYIRHDYVDTVSSAALAHHAIEGMLDRLDPHSSFVQAEDLKVANAQLEEDFDGIGVEFVMLKDTIQVISAIAGGPSAKAGVRAGDRIVRVDGDVVAGVRLNNAGVFNRLRGPRGSRVALSIVRPGVANLLAISLKRGRIPTRSLEAALMTDKETAYIKITRFSAGTDKEFRLALKDLHKQGMQRLVLDLRDNPGGYLDKAIRVADEFLEAGRLITYTDGKEDKYDARYKATKAGSIESDPVVVLINEGSASAAEILSGALQDNDRAKIVGRRSFGKGLVQMPISLSDGSELRLTISRYYTPAGRCIQKAYSPDDLSAYDEDLDHRYTSGELFSEDSIRNADTVRYRTTTGRIVYGGGGIRPDVFVPFDSSKNNALLTQLYNKYLISTEGTRYGQAHLKEIKAMGLERFRRNFQVSEPMFADLLEHARREGIRVRPHQLAAAKPTIRLAYKAFIARIVFGDRGYYTISLEDDDDFRKAMDTFPKRIAAR